MAYTDEELTDKCFEMLASLGGKELEIVSNINHPNQYPLIIVGSIFGEMFDSKYYRAKVDTALRLTISHKGRGRDDFITPWKSKSPENVYEGWNPLAMGQEIK